MYKCWWNTRHLFCHSLNACVFGLCAIWLAKLTSREREGLRHIKHAYLLPLQHPCIFDVCNCRLICAAFQIKDFGAGKGEGELEKGRERSLGLGREHFIFEAPPFPTTRATVPFFLSLSLSLCCKTQTHSSNALRMCVCVRVWLEMSLKCVRVSV